MPVSGIRSVLLAIVGYCWLLLAINSTYRHYGETTTLEISILLLLFIVRTHAVVTGVVLSPPRRVFVFFFRAEDSAFPMLVDFHRIYRAEGSAFPLLVDFHRSLRSLAESALGPEVVIAGRFYPSVILSSTAGPWLFI